MPAEHYRKLDVARGLAAIVVLLAHSNEIYLTRFLGIHSPVVALAGGLARHAVLIFFVLSGNLITASILTNLRRNGRFDAAHYLVSRITRIYPPLCGAVIVVLLVWVVVHVANLPGGLRPFGLPGDLYVVRNHISISFKDIVLALVMRDGLLDSDGPLWSLYIEFRLYVLAMFVTLGFSRKDAGRYAWLGLAALLFASSSRGFASFSFFSVIWAIGAVTALVRINRATLAWIAALSVAALVAVSFAHPEAFVIDDSQWQNQVVQALFALCYAYTLFAARILDRRMPRALVSTGQFSYSLYVIHFPLLLLGYSVTRDWTGNSWRRAVAVAIVASTCAVAFASWFAGYFENQQRFRPFIQHAFARLQAFIAASGGRAKSLWRSPS